MRRFLCLIRLVYDSASDDHVDLFTFIINRGDGLPNFAHGSEKCGVLLSDGRVLDPMSRHAGAW